MKHTDALLLLCMVAVATPASAGKFLVMCKDENGTPYFSDVSCPDDTEKVGKYYAPNAQTYSREWTDGDRQMLENYDNRVRRNLDSRSASVAAQEPPMSYSEAKKKAMDATGYKNYGRLTDSQRKRVKEEMAKYNHAPRPPAPRPAPAPTSSPPLLINGQPAINAGGGNYFDPRSGNFLQGTAGGVIDTKTGKFIPVH